MTFLEPGRFVAFAHRGGAYHPEIEGLENTLAGFRHAVALGYRYLETDVHVTADGVLLAFHDAVLDRVTDRVGVIADLTLEEVREARIDGREQVPTFASLLDAFPDARFNVDLKAGGTPRALADLVEQRGDHDRLLVGAFSPARIREFRRLTRGRVATAAHPLEIVAFRMAPTAAIARRLAGDGFVALQVPRTRGRLTVVTPGLLARAHASGLQVHVWTIDDAAEMAELVDMGVDGIFTDRTDVLKDVLKERDRWGP
ncbi:MAG: glycerophosphodiester phosphodiesterase [Nocardioidaceae bacterium]|nr:glycerophosphodiester phosphodiesterase [Nocardioidaceae bacterium]MCL2614639.1 glycerophosphodiester phosphodiesterase [Nocardioidaceae bacterium]